MAGVSIGLLLLLLFCEASEQLSKEYLWYHTSLYTEMSTKTTAYLYQN